jgi:aspartate-semialdehyde dehydrogenase
MSKGYCVAVVGATGAVGGEMVKILEEREFPVERLLPLASERSLGKEVEFRGEDLPVEVLDDGSFKGVDIALFSAGGAVSQRYAPIAAAGGTIVVDNTSAFRKEPDVPLVVPEVNREALDGYERRRIIANPNCSTIQMVVVLKPLHDCASIRRIVVSTYQSVSGAGLRAMEELSKQSVGLFSGDEAESEVFPHRIAFNCIPHIGAFQENGFTTEEMKLVDETRRILGDPSIRVSATAVRVPVFCGHGESVNVEFDSPIEPDAAREILASAPGVSVVDDAHLCRYPLQADCAGKDEVFVGRIRRDDTVENGLCMWIVADNIRKGAALNAVQIAEIIINDYL